MRRTKLFALCLLAAVGCSSSGSHPPDGGASDLATPSDLSLAPGSSFDTALAISVDATAKNGRLAGVATKDYYKVSLNQGDRIVAITTTKAAMVTDGSVTDTVVTIWDASKTKIAQDDDAWPRFSTDSALYFQAPATGQYFVTIEDCNSAAIAGGTCTMPSMITDFRYSLAIFHTARVTFPETNAAAAQNGTIANAQRVTYQVPSGAMAGHYTSSIIDGTFKSTTDTHVFGLLIPADTFIDTNQRGRAEFFVQPIGVKNGDGSTANVKVWVTDSGGTKILSQASQSNYHDGDNQTSGPLALSVPVTVGQQYYLFVQNTASVSTPATDYYFVQHFIGSFYYGTVEAEAPGATGTNDTFATAQVVTTPATAMAGNFFVDGDIASAGADVDWFEADAPAGTKSVFLGCDAARAGSGVVGLTATLYDATGVTALGSIGPDSATTDLFSPKITVPTGTAKAFLKVSATGQDATNTGTFYRCNVSYSNM